MTWKPFVAVLALVTLAFRSGQPPTPPAVAAPPIVATELVATPDVELVKWSFTQGGLSALLVWILWSYRRDFFRKIDGQQAEVDELRAEKRVLAAVIEKNADAMLQQALAVQANTEATKTLAQNVFVLADRRPHDKP